MQYDLVFEGGGAKGMVFVGACAEFFKRGHSFDRLLGTSAGAITATLLAAGYTPEELLEALVEKKDGKSIFAGFMGPPPPFTDEEIRGSAIRRLLDGIEFTFVPNLVESKLRETVVRAFATNNSMRHFVALVERGGWYAADNFVTWITTKLNSGKWKQGTRKFGDMTLAQFFAETAVEVSLVVSDTSDARLVVLNHRTAPDCPVVWAVRMSMSIPLVWDEVVWRESWGNYNGRNIVGHVMVDGGLLSNFPIELFISDAPQVVRLMGPKRSTSVLGMLIDENLAVAKGVLVRINVKPGELALVKRLQRLVDTATTAHDKMVIDEYSHLVARLPAGGYGTTEFDMSDERRDALVRAGREAIVLYFDTPSGLELPTKAFRPGARVATKADRIATELLEPAN